MAADRRISLCFPGCYRRGGVERIVFECARFLAARGHRVTVLANEWEPDETQPSIEYQHVPMRPKPSFLHRASFLTSCTRVLGQIPADVVNTHGCVCPFGGVLRVHSLHRDWLSQSRSRRKSLSGAGLRQRLNPLHSVLLALEAKHLKDRRYKRVIALSSHVKQAMHRYYGVPEEDVEIVPNGFSPSEFNPESRAARRKEMRAKLALTDDKIALLFVANELDRKGYATVLSALQRLNRTDLRLLVVGRVDAGRVKGMASASGAADMVMACGPTDDVAGYHAAADLFVLPTQYEAFCLAILEALGSGLPVVTSSVPGAMDAIIPGENGALVSDPDSGVELAEVLEPLLELRCREQLAVKAPGSVIQYQWPVVLARYEEVLLKNAG